MSSNDITITLAGDGAMNCLLLQTPYAPKLKRQIGNDKKHNRPLRNPELECSLEDQMEYLYELPPNQLQKDDLNDFLFIES